MGLCLGTELTEEEKKARTRSAALDRELFESARREMNVVKILLLGESVRMRRRFKLHQLWIQLVSPPGAAESGKSTLVKQMKIIHSHGFTKQELVSFKVGDTDHN